MEERMRREDALRSLVHEIAESRDRPRRCLNLMRKLGKAFRDFLDEYDEGDIGTFSLPIYCDCMEPLLVDGSVPKLSRCWRGPRQMSRRWP